MQKKKENVVVKQNCHSRGMLSGIYNACRYYKKRKALLNECVKDPRLRLSGMTLNVMGFTLIELLVVVLIIGILTAVAVPQYKKAVYRSRYANLKVLAESIIKAQTVYYLTNNKYATSFEELDVDMPGGKLNNSTTTRYYYDWGSCWIDAESTYTQSNCLNDQILMAYQHGLAVPGTEGNSFIKCTLTGTTDATDWRSSICQNEIGVTTPEVSNKWKTVGWKRNL